MISIYINKCVFSDDVAKSRKIIAFTAKLSSKISRHPIDPVIFSTVLTNIGSSYNSTSGKFTCPMRGTYVIAATLIGSTFSAARSFIMKNGVIQTQSFSQQQYSLYPTVSVHAVLSLRVGDDVWIKADYPISKLGSIFSGFLLHAD
jgi:hypothetical protein